MSNDRIDLMEEEQMVQLNIMVDEGLVGIQFGNETALVSWMDALEMATRLVSASYEAAASIEVDPKILMDTQMEMFQKVMGELRADGEDDDEDD